MTGREAGGLIRRHEHLVVHRRMILARALGAGAVGLVPVPLLDDWLVSTVRRGTIRRLASARQVDLDDAAVRALADGPATPPSWRDLVRAQTLALAVRRAWRRALLVLAVVQRAEAARRDFLVATLFDHYCARLHVGAGLDAAGGRRVRAAIDRAIDTTRGGMTWRLFRRGVIEGARAALRVPLDLLRSRDEGEAEEIVEGTLARASASWLGRAARAVEGELERAAGGYLADLAGAFEQGWRGAA